jgi:hypothetical protein
MHEEQELPPLPEPQAWKYWHKVDSVKVATVSVRMDPSIKGADEYTEIPLFSADAMRMYGRQCASLAKPQPVGGALTDWREECESAPAALFTGAKVLMFSEAALVRIGSAIEAATLSAPVAQPGEAVRCHECGNVSADCICAAETHHATPIAAQPAAAEADMRHILLVQIHNLIDLAERYSRLMHKRGDADERDRIDGEIAHVRKNVAPYNYNGPTKEQS